MRTVFRSALIGWLAVLLAGQTLFPLSQTQAGQAHCMLTHAHHALLQAPYTGDLDGRPSHGRHRMCCHFKEAVPAFVCEPAPVVLGSLLPRSLVPDELPELQPQIVLGLQVPPD